MKLWINSKRRKDGKFACTYGFNNGRRFKKIKSADDLRSELASGFDMVVTEADFENTIRKAAGRKLFYEF